MLKTAQIFSDHMVLQREKQITLWGTGDAGETVTVSLGTEKESAMVDVSGCWRVELDGRDAGGPYDLVIVSGNEQITFSDVMVGEVWLAGGQSNMEMELARSLNGAQEAAQCQNVSVRYFNVPKESVTGESHERAWHETGWKCCTPETAGAMSAVAYHFAREVSHSQQVTVGIIDCYWGGTSVSCWMSEKQLRRSAAGQEYLSRFETQVGEKTQAQYEAELQEYNNEFQTWQDRVSRYIAQHPEATGAELNQMCGACPWPPPLGRTSPFRPAGVYESMIRFVSPYTIRGFLYYQGEEDENRCDTYGEMMTYLIDQWRSDWEDDTIPFLFVQLPMYVSQEDYDAGVDNKHWAVLRDKQMKVSRTVSNTALAVLTDCGELDNVHPLDKRTVGHRLALLARKKVYAENVSAVAPCYQGHRVRPDGTVEVRFSNAEEGLFCTESILEGFETAGADGVFSSATGTVSGSTVILVPAMGQRAVYLRYAWTNYGPANLYGVNGLPAAPFRTDRFPVE